VTSVPDNVSVMVGFQRSPSRVRLLKRRLIGVLLRVHQDVTNTLSSGWAGTLPVRRGVTVYWPFAIGFLKANARLIIWGIESVSAMVAKVQGLKAFNLRQQLQSA
jgi:hypothetical protein